MFSLRKLNQTDGQIFSKSFKVYIKSGWNRLDFLIVTTSLIDVAIMVTFFFFIWTPSRCAQALFRGKVDESHPDE